VAIGVLAGAVVPPVLGVAAGLAGATADRAEPLVTGALDSARDVTAFAALLFLVIAAAGLVRGFLRRRVVVRSGDTWACAYPSPTPRMQYTASSFAAPLVRLFGALVGVREHRGATLFRSGVRDLVLDDVTLPAWRVVQRLALRLRPMQQGRLHIYLLYVIAALVALLAYLVLMPQAGR